MAALDVVPDDPPGDKGLPQFGIEHVTTAFHGHEEHQVALKCFGAECRCKLTTVLPVTQHARCLVRLELAEHVPDLSRRGQYRWNADRLAAQARGIEPH